MLNTVLTRTACAILHRMDPVRALAMVAELRGRSVSGWTVVELAGSGKSAVVFKAERDGVTAALKVFDRELVERFGADVQERRLRRELSLVGQRHPNLVQILDGGYDDTFKVWFVVMEYLQAKTLTEVLDKIPRERIWPIIAQVAGAARFLEERELCHRDIKPDNIAISPDYEHATLLDLGVLKPFGASTETPITDEDELVFVGTLQYASPEFMNRIEEDDKDGWRGLTIYQLGTVLHDLIMRRRIFGDVKPYPRLVVAVGGEVPEVAADDVPADLVLITKNCLLKDSVLRTRYVGWDSFEPPSSTADPMIATRDRVRRRMNLTNEAPAIPEWQKQRDAIAALGEIFKRIDDAIRDVCTASDILPPAVFRHALNAMSREGVVTVQFDPSPRHHLATNLTFCFRVRLLDPLASVVQIDGLAATSRGQLALTPECGTPLGRVFEGSLDERVVRQHFETVLITAFDSAQSTPMDDLIRWLFSGTVS